LARSATSTRRADMFGIPHTERLVRTIAGRNMRVLSEVMDSEPHHLLRTWHDMSVNVLIGFIRKGTV